MGMTGGLYRASDAEIRELIEAPESIEAFVAASTWAPPVREVRPRGALGWLMKLLPITVVETDPDAAPPTGYDPARDRPHCDLESVWHGLHFLLTGTALEGDEPACYLLRGGLEIGDPDALGYSVLQAIDPAETQRFAGFLGSLSRDVLARRFDPARMTALEIDPGGWTDPPRRDARREQLLAAFDELRAFVQGAAEVNDGLVVYVS